LTAVGGALASGAYFNAHASIESYVEYVVEQRIQESQLADEAQYRASAQIPLDARHDWQAMAALGGLTRLATPPQESPQAASQCLARHALRAETSIAPPMG
jgi:hypothetical protein